VSPRTLVSRKKQTVKNNSFWESIETYSVAIPNHYNDLDTPVIKYRPLDILTAQQTMNLNNRFYSRLNMPDERIVLLEN